MPPAQLGFHPDHERDLARLLSARHPDVRVAEWRARLTVACAVAAFRVWLDDFFRHTIDDPLGHLDQVLAALPTPE